MDIISPITDSPSLTVAHVDLTRLRHNVRALREHAGEAEILAVIKANAYGHGMLPVARTLRDEGVSRFAVAVLSEAIQLRSAGFGNRILVFAGPMPEHLATYAEYDLDVSVTSHAIAEAAIKASRDIGPLRVHVKVDTGMGRLGVTPPEAIAMVQKLERTPGLEIAGIWTHFSSADEMPSEYTAQQLERFHQVVDVVGDAAENLHCANSAALLLHPETYASLPRALVRPGLALYGQTDWPDPAVPVDLLPVLQVTARVVHVKTVPTGAYVSYGRRWQADKPSRIATISAGYADGYPRILSNRASVGIAGTPYPVVGSVCMDMTMVNLGDPNGPGAGVEVGDEVVLAGDGGPSVSRVAAWADTIPYEICCGVAPRVPRRYTDM